MGESYTGFAEVYDELMDDVPYEKWCERICASIDRYGISKRVSRVPKKSEEFAEAEADGTSSEKTEMNGVSVEEADESARLESERNLVVDLGCGTGTLTEMLYDSGFDMIGIDNSEDMLGIAMEKRQESGSEILYLNQDMRELELYSTVGTVVSVCDSLNYILEDEELEQVFGLVHNYLYPGGLFIFDFNTDYKYREIIGDGTIAENREDCSFIWENEYDEESGINEYDLTFYVRDDSGKYERFEETHYQKGYTPEVIGKMLSETGFELIKMTDSETEGEIEETSQRIYVVAKCIKETGGRA